MRKIISLFLCLYASLSATDPPKPKLYQSLWPNFCSHHLEEVTVCSEMNPSIEFYWGGDDYMAADAFFPFLSRLSVDTTFLGQSTSLPLLSSPCAYTHCKYCGHPVRKSIGIYSEDYGDAETLEMMYMCNCSRHTCSIPSKSHHAFYETRDWRLCKQNTVPFAYFNQFTSKYRPFLGHILNHNKEHPSCSCYWPYVSPTACNISDLVYKEMSPFFKVNPSLAYNPEEWCFNDYLPAKYWPELGEECLLRSLQNYFVFTFFYSNYHSVILDLCSYVDNNSLTPSNDLEKLYATLAMIRPLFLTLYSDCLEKHPHPKIYYERGMVYFHNGDLFSSLLDMKAFTSSIDDDTLISSDFYLQEGTSYAELGLYDEAVQALSKSIAKDPQNKESYFERAAAYFEMGDFDHSIEDYLQSGLSPTTLDLDDISSLAFSKHLITGITKGTGTALYDFAPSLLASANGLSHGLWALICDPVNCSKEMVSSCKDLLQALSQNSSRELLEAIIPEIKDLYQCQSQEEKAHQLGFIIGKYGTEILAPVGALKAYKNLRSANRILTLDHLAKTSAESSLLKEASTQWSKAHLDSVAKFKTGEAILKTHKSQYFTETTARKIIHQAGFETFPRPKGIPDNFRITFSDRGCGMKYVHPNHTFESVRIMPGKPHSPNLHQQKPYVVHMRDDAALDIFGNKVAKESIEAHIPLEKFVYKTE